ncbi:unnamed protein product [Brugia timori]|uniref:Cyclic nucleotide-binding domain-containing protein n=1 Tax=Brugia timori TaxID=42155 RepID=A0A0R3QMW5_9BILA|nr:unnamed protein product [Brugia timori]
MDRLVARIQRQSRSKQFSDALLFTVLGNSDCKPKQIANGVLLFQSGDQIFYWYLLLSGEVQLFLSTADVSFLSNVLFFKEKKNFLKRKFLLTLNFELLCLTYALHKSESKISLYYQIDIDLYAFFLKYAPVRIICVSRKLFKIKCANEIKNREAEKSCHDAVSFQNERIIETLQPIALFGELSISRHSCSARIIRPAEIVTINQSHFVAIYNVCVIFFVINFNNN